MLNYEKNCLTEYMNEEEDAMIFTGDMRCSLDSTMIKIVSCYFLCFSLVIREKTAAFHHLSLCMR